MTREEISFTLTQIGAYFGILIRDNKATNVEFELFQKIQDLKKADVRQNVHGEWIDDGFYIDKKSPHVFRCSNCGTQYFMRNIENENFCKNCGADMRGEKNE